MNNLKNALMVLKILEREGYESYLVGGVVRDYILKRKFNDIDITTVAKPNEVLKHFKGVPTGVRYGTVTVSFRNEKFEVTTFRSEDTYNDYRRPERVTFEEDVLKDVLRRDFTINGLLMNKDEKIIDHVGGLEDLENKLIKTIGNPLDRFSEDALRMMRAFYFQSKLGFKIEDNTLKAIENNRKLINEVASERVLEELNKLLNEENYLMALNSMYQSKVHEVIPGLKKGVEIIVNRNEEIRPAIFFALSFYLNKSIPKYFKFPNRFRHQISQIIELLNKGINYDKIDLFNYGLNNVLDANYINYLLNKDKLKEKEIKRLYDNINITSTLDLKFRARDILTLTKRKQGAWLNNLLNDLTEKVILGELKNEYEELKKYVLETYERF